MASNTHSHSQAAHHTSPSAPYYATHHSSPIHHPNSAHPPPHPQHSEYRSHGPAADHHAAAHSHRTYESALPAPPSEAHHAQTHTDYPPAPSSPADSSWAIKPSAPLTHWSDHSQRPPAGTPPHAILPQIPPKATEESSKGPMISRLKSKLVGGRYPLSRTWEKASFVEECRSAPASMESLPSAGDAAAGGGGVAAGREGDVDLGGEGRRREKRGGVSGDGAFTPSGRPVSLYASPAALRAFKPLPGNVMPTTPSPGQPRGLTSA